MGVLSLNKMFTFLIGPHSKWCPSPNYMTLPHQNDEEEEREDCEEPHHSIYPAYGDLCNPLVDVEVDGEAEEQTH